LKKFSKKHVICPVSELAALFDYVHSTRISQNTRNPLRPEGAKLFLVTCILRKLSRIHVTTGVPELAAPFVYVYF